MTVDEVSSASLRFSTDALPPARREDALREHFAQKVQLTIDVDPQLPVDMTIDTFPGLRRTRMVSPLTGRLERPSPMLADGEDSVCLVIKTGGDLALRQHTGAVEPRAGDAVLLVYREPAVLDFRSATYVAVRAPADALATLVTDVGPAAGRCIPGDTDALALLRCYVESMPARMINARLGRLSAQHVYDLIALVVGAHAEGREQARRGGLKAARLEAIKADIVSGDAPTLAEVSTRHGISPRTVQLLFEQEGTTFSEFVLETRIDLAKAMLTSPRYDAWSVAGIAYEAGFGDLSHFNRRFKRRFHMTPTELRAQARVDRPGDPAV